MDTRDFKIAETQIKSIKLSKREQKFLALLYRYCTSDASMCQRSNIVCTFSNYDFNRIVGTRSFQERVKLYDTLSRKFIFSGEQPGYKISFIVINGIDCDSQRIKVRVNEDFLPIMKKFISLIVDSSYLKLEN